MVLAFAIVIAINSFGQKNNYKEYKNDFSAKHYRDSITKERYSPFNAGMLNFLLPSTGYHYIEEPLRGWCVLGCELIPLSVAFFGVAASFGEPGAGGHVEGTEKLFNYGILAFELIQIWSCYDVVKVTKIKNLAYQEGKITLKIKPEFLVVNQNNNSSIACGLSLNITF